MQQIMHHRYYKYLYLRRHRYYGNRYHFAIVLCCFQLFLLQTIIIQVSGGTTDAIDNIDPVDSSSSSSSCHLPSSSATAEEEEECVVVEVGEKEEEIEKEKEEKEEAIVDEEECGVWLAPSTIPGSGLGMYAGRRFEKDEQIQSDSVVPIVDLEYYHNITTDHYNNFLWSSYTWSLSCLNMTHDGIRSSDGASPGFGSVANSFLDLINVDEKAPIHKYPDDPHMHRSNDPGIGAFSPYHSRPYLARRPIEPGQEFFVDYGTHWFKNRPIMATVPLLGDLERGTQLFAAYFDLTQKTTTTSTSTSTTLWNDLWQMFVVSSSWNTSSRVIGAFTETTKETLLEQWSQPPKNNNKPKPTLFDTRVQESTRTLQWLQENGNCADNIVGKTPSTLSHAGNGAFATRSLRAETVVAQLPMIHMNRKLFDVYHISKHNKIQRDTVVRKQILLNYCYGHSNSSVLLCPYSPITNLINHNQTRANVKLRWADPKRGNHDAAFLKKTPEELFAATTSVLAMELVATRDILPGEEVLLNYGDEWEQSWSRHIQNWNPPPQSQTYATAREWNVRLDEEHIRLRTEFEKMKHPYPANLLLKCNLDFFTHIDKDTWNKTRTVEYHGNTNPRDIKWELCEVLRVDTEEVFFEIQRDKKYFVYTATNVGVHAPDTVLKIKRLRKAPKDAFRFFDVPLSTDIHLQNAFRHEIMIPDALFPNQWLHTTHPQPAFVCILVMCCLFAFVLFYLICAP